ncbi:MAG: MFS transporter [Gemmataceae bacterium]
MNSPVSPERPTRVRYGVLGFCAALSMITYLDRVCMGTVMPDIQREFGLTDSQKGWLFGAFTLAYAAFEVPTGWLGDRFGARNTLIRIVLWWSVFTVLTGLVYPMPTAPARRILGPPRHPIPVRHRRGGRLPEHRPCVP